MMSKAYGITPVKSRECDDCGWTILADDKGVCFSCEAAFYEAAEYCGCGMVEGCENDSPE